MSPSSDTPDPKRDLRLVDDTSEATAAAASTSSASEELTSPSEDDASLAPEPAQTPAPAETASTSYFTWFLLAAVLLFAWLWLTQLEVANGLEADLVGVRGELAAAKTDIVAWETHGESVRSGVAGIVAQLGALQQLVADVPTAGTALPSDATSGDVAAPLATEASGASLDASEAPLVAPPESLEASPAGLPGAATAPAN